MSALKFLIFCVYCAVDLFFNALNVKEFLFLQKNSRLILFEEFCRRSNGVLEQWNADIDKVKQIEEQLEVSC